MKSKKIIIAFVALLFISGIIILEHLYFPKKSIKVVHTVSYSNAVVFWTIQKFPQKIEGVLIPDPAKHIEILLGESANQLIVTVTPYANALIAIDKNDNLKIIAGSGFNGISLIARVDSISKLKGKRIGTSKGDSLEDFLVELLESEGFKDDDYQIVYFTDPFEAIEAIKNGQIDAVTHVEPFATQLIEENKMFRLRTSKDLWGNHPDAIVITTKSIIEKYPNELQWFIDELKLTENEILSRPDIAASELSVKYYNISKEKLLEILQYQFPKIDIRAYESFFIKRGETLQKLKYLDKPVSTNAFDWRFLNNK